MPTTTSSSTSATVSSITVAAPNNGIRQSKMSKEGCYLPIASHHYSTALNTNESKAPRLPIPLQSTYTLPYYNQRPGTSTGVNSMTNSSLDGQMRKELINTPSLKSVNALNLQNIPNHWIWNTSSLLYASYGSVSPSAVDMPPHYGVFPSHTFNYSLLGTDTNMSRTLTDDKATKRIYDSDDSEASDERKIEEEVR